MGLFFFENTTMQVSHAHDHITHAIIGGKQAINFGISDSAEFFNILSSTLYKDQILAVVREVLCNAWDAHIEAGCTDRPVEVTLTHDVFTIKDFGKGIHLDDMGLIYGTYGNSTKKNDGLQTGGFGLGCKAPFAYTDHFEVTSAHAGIKTVYNLSKSSAQVMGKPSITPIASFPSTESGLQVSIRIKSGDRDRFQKLIQRIARNGDMHIMFNGKVLPQLGFTTTVATNYLITQESNLLDTPSPIMVRYGNVIYPVDQGTALSVEYNRIVAHLNSLKNWRSNDHYRIIFQAPPHSISVTPSRESLSMQDHTVKTLKGLFDGFLALLDKPFLTACDHFAKESVLTAVNEKQIAKLLHIDAQLPSIGQATTPATQINDLATMARQYLTAQYPKSLAFRKEDIRHRLTSMVAAGLLNQGIVQTFLRAMQTVTTATDACYEKTDWLQRQIIAPVMTKLQQAGLDHTRLYALAPTDAKQVLDSHHPQLLVEAKRVAPTHLFTTMPYLRNIVVVSTSKMDIAGRAYRHDVFKRLGAYAGFLFYHASMKKAEKEAALAFFKSSGMEVVDLTFKQPWEFSAAITKPVVPVPRKPKKEGVVALKQIRLGSRVHTRLIVEESAERILAPEFMVNVSLNLKQSTDILNYWDARSTGYIVDLFGAKGGITNNSAIHEKWLQKGAKELDAYVQEKVCAVMQTSAAIQEFWAFNPARVIEAADSYSTPTELLTLVYGNALLRKEFGLVNNLTEEESKYVYLWTRLLRNLRHRVLPDDVAQTKKQLEGIPLDPANAALLKKFKHNRLLDVVNGHSLVRLIEDSDAAAPIVKNAIQLLTLALNN